MSSFNAKEAVEFIQKQFGDGLSTNQAQEIEKEIKNLKEDPILVLNVNPQWAELYSTELADEIIQAINAVAASKAQLKNENQIMPWLIHFDLSQHIYECQEEIFQKFPQAFAYSPLAIAAGGLHHGAPTVPLARSVVIHKVSANEEETDMEPFNFFYV